MVINLVYHKKIYRAVLAIIGRSGRIVWLYMNHLHHLKKNKEMLELRFHIIRLIREWFFGEGFLEVETPLILRYPGQEPYLSPMKLTVHDERGTAYQAYLHTSPEYTMKKMLSAGFDKIFFLGKVFRDHESFGGTHNPEFTMIEWYRAGEDFWKLMEDVESLFSFVVSKLGNNEMAKLRNQKMTEFRNFDISQFRHFRKVHMRELWREYAGVNLDDYLDVESMRQLCISNFSIRPELMPKGFQIADFESYEDLFFRIFLNYIEPKLTEPTIIHHYPAPMAALAKLSSKEPGYAERFEVYVGGMEIANCFTELTDADEQLRRLEAEKKQRQDIGKDVYDIDMEFIEALRHMPPAAGIALGVDRLAQVLLDCRNIDNMIPLPASKLFMETRYDQKIAD